MPQRQTALFVLIAVAASTAAAADGTAALPETVAAGAEVLKVFDGKEFYEGPMWDPGTGKLYFTAFGASSHIMRLDEPGRATRWSRHTSGINGMFLSNEGRLLAAQAVRHRIMSYAINVEGPHDAQILAEDRRWHQPNDLCQTPNGNIYFTDPDLNKNADSGVYLLTPDGTCQEIISDMAAPNGIIASIDGRTLYVSDSDQLTWRSYPIREDGTVGAGRVFFSPDTFDRTPPDGMSIDERGNLYFTGRGGVWVVSPEGKSLGLIPLRDFCSNCTFGGRDGRTLFVTCTRKIYSLKMVVRGAQFVREPG